MSDSGVYYGYYVEYYFLYEVPNYYDEADLDEDDDDVLAQVNQLIMHHCYIY